MLVIAHDNHDIRCGFRQGRGKSVDIVEAFLYAAGYHLVSAFRFKPRRSQRQQFLVADLVAGPIYQLALPGRHQSLVGLRVEMGILRRAVQDW